MRKPARLTLGFLLALISILHAIPALPQTKFMQTGGAAVVGGGTGTVESVAVTVPAFMGISGSPITESGTLAFTFNTQAQGLVFASPCSGTGAVVFRALCAADIPALDPSKITGTAVITSDARLSDARTPIVHASTHASAGSDAVTIAPSQVTGTAVVTADARLSDARTPTAHASSHNAAGSDQLTVALGTDTSGGYAGSATEGGAATTADALSANGTNCTSGSAAGGVSASGNAEDCAVLAVNTTATASNFFTAYNSTTGAFTKAQPAFTDISGTASSAQIPNNAADTTGKSAATDALNSASTVVNVSSATAPTSGQVLTATSGTAATWQTPSASGANTALSNLASVAINTALATGAGTAASFTATAPTQTASAQAGINATVTASPAVAGSSNAGAATGGRLDLKAGAAARLTSGNAQGGHINLEVGSGIGTGTSGFVSIYPTGNTGSGPLGTAVQPLLQFACFGANCVTGSNPGLWLTNGNGIGVSRGSTGSTVVLNGGSGTFGTFMSAGRVMAWASGDTVQSNGNENGGDTGISRVAAGVLCVGNSAAADCSGSARSTYSEHVVGANVASATTITPTGGIFHVTGTTTITTINLPRVGFTGCLRIIPDGAFATNTGGNIALASTAVVSRVLEMCYTGSLWYPSY